MDSVVEIGTRLAGDRLLRCIDMERGVLGSGGILEGKIDGEGVLCGGNGAGGTMCGGKGAGGIRGENLVLRRNGCRV